MLRIILENKYVPMYRNLLLKFILLILISGESSAQVIQELNSGGDISLRGLSVVNDNTVWVSGSKGKVGKTLDGGKTWKWMTVKGYEKSDFRDIEAFSKKIAIIMAVAEPAFILKTTNGGESWKKVYENNAKGMFLDAMDFIDNKNGYVIGDPINGRFFIAKTIDGGETWQEYNRMSFPIPDSTEACFASSGTNVRIINKDRFVYVTGGVYSNIVMGKQKIKLPLTQGKETTGANSIAVKDSNTYIIVGGDFSNVAAMPNCAITSDGGKKWTLPQTSPFGYKSCVEYISGNTWICCGLTGIDISNDNGENWKQISNVSYHACRKSKKGKKIYFSGNNSRIGVIN
ncbi:MAG: YCF48-related protein [Bacteroidetes bacterium]|nr:YCF48-related protein [Bacteroidota bacterium]